MDSPANQTNLRERRDDSGANRITITRLTCEQKDAFMRAVRLDTLGDLHGGSNGFILNDGTFVPCHYGSHSDILMDAFRADSGVSSGPDGLCRKYGIIRTGGLSDMHIVLRAPMTDDQAPALRRLVDASGLATECIMFDAVGLDRATALRAARAAGICPREAMIFTGIHEETTNG